MKKIFKDWLFDANKLGEELRFSLSEQQIEQIHNKELCNLEIPRQGYMESILSVDNFRLKIKQVLMEMIKKGFEMEIAGTYEIDVKKHLLNQPSLYEIYYNDETGRPDFANYHLDAAIQELKVFIAE